MPTVCGSTHVIQYNFTLLLYCEDSCHNRHVACDVRCTSSTHDEWQLTTLHAPQTELTTLTDRQDAAAAAAAGILISEQFQEVVSTQLSIPAVYHTGLLRRSSDKTGHDVKVARRLTPSLPVSATFIIHRHRFIVITVLVMSLCRRAVWITGIRSSFSTAN